MPLATKFFDLQFDSLPSLRPKKLQHSCKYNFYASLKGLFDSIYLQ
jgi:hypothetical protein